MSTSKKIHINPELFKMTGRKTRKNKETEKPIPPLISPNNLKNKLPPSDSRLRPDVRAWENG